MAVVGELSFDFTINAASVGSAFSQVENRVGQLEQRLKTVGNSGLAGFKSADFDRSIDASKEKVGALGDSIKQVIGFAAGFGVFSAAATAVSSAWNFAKNAVIGFNDLQLGAEKGFTSMLGSAEQAQNMLGQLRQFAAATPFEFQGLLDSSRQLMAFGIAADQVIPLLTDIGNAASYFHAGQAGIDRMTYAIGQMNAAVILHTQDLNQLTDIGVPTWQILADGMHKTVPEIRDMVEKGQIASSTFIDLFDQWARAPERAGQMAAANSTLSGSLSTVHDQIQFLISDAFRPMYDFITKLANQLAQFLSSDAFNAFSAQVVASMGNVFDALSRIPDAIGEIGDVWGRFVSDFKNGGIAGVFTDLADNFSHLFDGLDKAMESGGIGAAILQFAGNLADRLLDAAPSWAQAGATLIETFAQGMWDAVSGTVTAVVNAIADFIGSFFIGSSPPPAGPLSKIDEAGTILMQTYTDGMRQGLTGLNDIPDMIMEVMTQFNPSEIFAGLNTAITDGTVSLKDMQDAAASAADAMTAINGAEQQLDFQISNLKFEIADISDEYDRQIDALKEQLDVMNQQRDWALEMQDLQLQSQDVQLRMDMHNDANLKSAQDQLKAAQAAAKGVGGGGASPQEQQQLLNLQNRLRSVPNDKAHADARKQIQNQIAGLQSQTKQQGILSKEQKDAAQAQVQAAQDNLDRIKATYDARRTDLDYQKEGVSLTKEQQDVAKKIAELPLEQQQQELTQQRDAATKPLRDQLDNLTRQKSLLDLQKAVWESIAKLTKDTASNMEKAAKAMEDAAKKAAGGAGGAAKIATGGAGGAAKAAIGGVGGGLNIPHQSLLPSDAEIKKTTDTMTDSMAAHMKERAGKVGQSLVDGVGKYIRDNWGRVLLGAIGGAVGGSIFGPIGSLIGSAIGSHFGPELQKRIESINWQDVMSRVSSLWQTIREGAVDAYDKLMAVWKQAQPRLSEIWDNISTAAVSMFKSVKNGFDQMWPTIRDNFLPTLAKIGFILLDVALPAAMKFIGWFVQNVSPVFINFYSTILAAAIDGLIAFAGWFTDTGLPAIQAFFGWLQTNALPPLEALGGWLMGTGVPALESFFGWLQTNALPPLQAVGDFLMNVIIPALGAFAGWITGTGLPAIQSFFGWIQSNAGPPLQALGTFISGTLLPSLQAFGSWLVGVGVPALQSFFGWIQSNAGPILSDIGDAFNTQVLPAAKVVIAWFTGTFQPQFMNMAGAVGDAAQGIANILTVTWGVILKGVQATWPLIQSIIEITWNTIKTVVSVALPIIQSIIENGFTAIQGAVQLVWDAITGLIDGAMKVIEGGLEIFAGIFTGDWGKMWDGVKTLVEGIWQLISTVIQTALGAIELILSTAWQSISDGADLAWQSIWKIIDGIWTNIQTGIQGYLTTIHNLIDTAWTDIGSIFEKSKTTIWDAIKWPFEQAASQLGGIIGGIESAVKGPFASIANGIHSVLNGLRSGINWLAGKFDLPLMGEVPAITWAAQGVTDFKGGPAIVGERGWELGIIDGKPKKLGANGPQYIPNLPEHATVVPHDLSEKLVKSGMVPGFVGGINFDWLGDAVGVLGKGKDWLFQQMMDHFVKIPDMDTKVFGDLSGAIINFVKKSVIDWIGGGLKNILPVSPDSIQAMISFADANSGLPYIWGGGHGGGGGPGIGFDCSGFVAAVLDAGGIPNPHGIVTAFYEWMKQGRTGIVDLGVENPYAAPDVQHIGIGLMGQWYESGGLVGGSGKTRDYFPIIGYPPTFPDQAKGGADAASLAWYNIITGVVGQGSLGKQLPPLSGLDKALAEAQAKGKVRAYRNGGAINEPVDGRGRWSGDAYAFGESKRETYVAPYSSTAPSADSGGLTITGDINVNVTAPDNVEDPEEWGSAAGRGFIREAQRLNGRS